MLRTLRPGRLGAALGLVSVLLLSACTSSGPQYTAGQQLTKEQAVSLVKSAYDAITTAHMELSMTAPSNGGTATITTSTDGDYTTSPITLSGTINMAQGGQTLQVQVVLVDSTLYMNMGAASGNKYLQMSLAQLSSATGTSFLDAFDPEAAMTKTSDSFTGGTYVARETVNGEVADHYRVAIDYASYIDANPTAFASVAPSDLAALKASPVNEDFWIDTKGRLVKQAIAFPTGTTSTATFSNFGAAVSISAPPSEQVTAVPSTS